ncbi:MAG: S-layer homology domain-containing protein [Defluviitaleaceae bacterium]|nr:S-layer homology domain-containing protein [Defluviitaleaceae bacterium]
MKKLTFYCGIAVLLAVTTVFMCVPQAQADGGGAPSAWAAEGVERAKALGFVPLHLQSDYTKAATRAEFCALAVTIYEDLLNESILERKYFSDTDDVNVQKMGGLGVVSGVGDDEFLPDGTITREQAAAILTRLMRELGVPLSDNPPAFSDNDDISQWARAAVGQVQAAGIMGGTGNNMFSPNANYTVEQSIITLKKVYDLAFVRIWRETDMLNEYAERVIELVNIERAKEGLGPLVTYDLLHAAAILRATECEVRFSHTRPDYRPWYTVFSELGISNRGRGENLGMGYMTPESAVIGWMNSPEHRPNIMNPKVSRTGVGVHEGVDGKLYWAQLFID